MFFRRALSTNPVNLDVGLLVLRVGIGFTFIAFHGYSKISGGPETWAAVGANMKNLGITFAPAFWGFMAAFAEFFCPILIMLGVLFRPALLLMAFTMFVAMMHHLSLPADAPRAGWSGASHALELFVICISLLLTGAGRYAFRLIHKRDLKHN